MRIRGNAAVSRNSRRAAASGRWANAVPQERAQAGRRHSLASPRIGVGRWENSQARKRRGGGLQCRAVASPGPPLFGTLSLTLPFGEINLDFIASALGYAMGAGSLLLFAPIIVNLLQAKTAKGMSISTWVLQLTAFAGSTLYNISKGHPFSTFAESACLGVQSLFILLLVRFAVVGPDCGLANRLTSSPKGRRFGMRLCSQSAQEYLITMTDILHYQDRLDARVLAGVLLFLVVCALALWGLPPSAWTPVQIISSATGVGALLPQILLNFKQGNTGEWSAITAGLSTAGNGLRVFTTIQLTGDPVLMVGFTAGFLVNLTLFLQILYYASRGTALEEGASALQQGEREKS